MFISVMTLTKHTHSHSALYSSSISYKDSLISKVRILCNHKLLARTLRIINSIKRQTQQAHPEEPLFAQFITNKTTYKSPSSLYSVSVLLVYNNYYYEVECGHKMGVVTKIFHLLS